MGANKEVLIVWSAGADQYAYRLYLADRNLRQLRAIDFHTLLSRSSQPYQCIRRGWRFCRCRILCIETGLSPGYNWGPALQLRGTGPCFHA